MYYTKYLEISLGLTWHDYDSRDYIGQVRTESENEYI